VVGAGKVKMKVVVGVSGWGRRKGDEGNARRKRRRDSLSRQVRRKQTGNGEEKKRQKDH
jgi:hypothetical protein